MIEQIEVEFLGEEGAIIYNGNIYKLIKGKITCKKCGCKFLSDRRSVYCSRQCRESYYNRVVIRERYGEDRICLYCKEKYTAYKYSATICCSRACARLLTSKVKEIQKKGLKK